MNFGNAIIWHLKMEQLLMSGKLADDNNPLAKMVC